MRASRRGSVRDYDWQYLSRDRDIFTPWHSPISTPGARLGGLCWGGLSRSANKQKTADCSCWRASDMPPAASNRLPQSDQQHRIAWRSRKPGTTRLSVLLGPPQPPAPAPPHVDSPAPTHQLSTTANPLHFIHIIYSVVILTEGNRVRPAAEFKQNPLRSS